MSPGGLVVVTADERPDLSYSDSRLEQPLDAGRRRPFIHNGRAAARSTWVTFERHSDRVGFRVRARRLVVCNGLSRAALFFLCLPRSPISSPSSLRHHFTLSMGRLAHSGRGQGGLQWLQRPWPTICRP
jgi:hypothetical protein